jgi:hypothetical protein
LPEDGGRGAGSERCRVGAGIGGNADARGKFARYERDRIERCRECCAVCRRPECDGRCCRAIAKPAAPQRFDIDDFAVQGADKLPEIDIEEAIYPFLGPNKSADDVEKARAALEKAYHDKGYQTVSVSVPEQNAQRKVITLKVTELKVGRLRVKNSRYSMSTRSRTGRLR